MKQSNGVVQKLADILREILGAEKRAISMPDVYNKLARSLDEGWLVDVFLDGSAAYAIIAQGGKLYKATISIDTDKKEVSVAESDAWEEVEMEYLPVAQQRMQLRKQADGTVRWFLIAGTTILNRNGTIDSTELFDGFVRQASEEGKYPFLTFYHIHELRMGQCDFLARDGVALLASGTFDQDNIVAEAMIRAYESEPEYWGSSIGFATDPDTVERVEIAPDIRLPVYKEGELSEISVLPEHEACALMTAMLQRSSDSKEIIMNKRTKDALSKLAGGDEELLDQIEAKVDDVNRTVAAENLIHRNTEEEASEEEAAPPAAEEPAPGAEEAEDEDDEDEEEEEGDEEVPELILSDQVVQMIADQASAVLRADIQELADQLAAAQKEISDLHASIIQHQKKTAEEIKRLDRSEDEKRQEWEQDMSDRVVNKMRVSYRPTARAEAAQDAPQSFAEVANETLVNIK